MASCEQSVGFCAEREIPAITCPPQVQAQLLLGQMHVDTGRFADAFPYFEAAARSGHPTALNMLGRAYERGWGVVRNTGQAALYFEEAAQLGDAWAMFNLADLLLLGDGVPKDRARAYRLYVFSAEKGNAKALNMLGLLHEEGIAGTPDLEGAKIFFQAAAEGGDCWAEINLSRLALAHQDIAAAASCLQRALKTGLPDVCRAIIAAVQPYADPALKSIGAQAVRQLGLVKRLSAVPA
ncbi:MULTISPECIES: tetratricopeptide repeat protein [unclassified Gluconobacter]|uniref:tetratricopeptide repeat protein n=1 Tax=unclassified Gluconobacter TaxID=2644261 RepID=UPI001C045EFD|nr:MULTISPECIES: tetratricopeptide repeat protein [unclassified Gluconobacter]